MTISVTAFKANCLELLRQLEGESAPIEITRHGKIVARLVPPAYGSASVSPWERLRGTGVLLATAGESVLSDDDFDALR